MVLSHTFASLNPHNILSGHYNRFYHLCFMNKKLKPRRPCPRPKAWCSSKYPVFPSTESSTLLQNHQFEKKKKKRANTTEPEFSLWEKSLMKFRANAFSKSTVCSLLACRLVWLLGLFPGSSVLRVKSWCTFTDGINGASNPVILWFHYKDIRVCKTTFWKYSC